MYYEHIWAFIWKVSQNMAPSQVRNTAISKPLQLDLCSFLGVAEWEKPREHQLSKNYPRLTWLSGTGYYWNLSEKIFFSQIHVSAKFEFERDKISSVFLENDWYLAPFTFDFNQVFRDTRY